MTKEWDLNIFFEELEDGASADVITINPVIWTKHDDGRTENDYTDIIYKTTFAEARYIRSEYPLEEYGYDWTDSLENFMEIAPPRLKSLLGTLPMASVYRDLKSLVG